MFSLFRTALILLVTLMLTRFIPFSSFFRNVNTLVHELGHAIAALLLQGRVMEIRLNPDQSGVTLTSFQEAWMSIPISLAGYMGASLFALLLFVLYAKGKVATGLALIAASAAIALALFVRNGYGMAWCAGFAIVTGLIWMFGPAWLQKGYYLLIAFLCLEESVVSSGILLYLSIVDPSGAGDAANLSRSALLPAFVWALLFVLFSLWCAKHALKRLFARREPARVEREGGY